MSLKHAKSVVIYTGVKRLKGEERDMYPNIAQLAERLTVERSIEIGRSLVRIRVFGILFNFIFIITINNSLIAVRYIKPYVQLLALLVVLLLHLLAHLRHLAVFAVVQDAVRENQLYVLQEVLHVQVLVVAQLLFYRSKVHWVLDDVEVVRDLQLLGVHWLQEDPGLVQLHEVLHHAHGYLLPVVLNGCRLVDGWHLHLLNGRFVLEKLGDVGQLLL